MNSVVLHVLLSLLGFLSGGVPYGYIIARFKGINIKEHGSGNIGATNVFRILGKKWGITVFLLDVAKGAVPVLISRFIFNIEYPQIVGFFSIMGHIFSPFLGFRGGKGVATSIGVFASLLPIELVISLIFWPITFLVTRIASLSSFAFVVVLPIVILISRGFGVDLVFSIVVMVVIIMAHRDNIKRLIKGKEAKL